MMRGNPIRAFTAVVIVIALTTGGLTLRTSAQSEFRGSNGFPYTAFDKLPVTDIGVHGADVRLAFAPGHIALPKATLIEWVKRSATAVSTYYGKFPVKSPRILMVPNDGRGVQGGTTWG